MKQPLVSVIINTYNYEDFIEKAVESALNQDFPGKEREIIVVDDGSTDSTPERLRKYHGEIVYIYKKNRGQASALNAGIAAARGSIIAFLDADDYWAPNKLRSVVDIYEKFPSVGFVYHNLNMVDIDENFIRSYLQADPDTACGSGIRSIDLGAYLKGRFYAGFIPTSGITARSSCLNKMMPVPEDYRICADTYIHFILPFYAEKFAFIDEGLGCYKMHGENLFEDMSMKKKKLAILIPVYKRLVLDIEAHCSALSLDCKWLKRTILDYVTGWNCMLNDKRLPFRLVFNTHYRILDQEGIGKYLLYSYRYRSKQAAALISRFRKTDGAISN